MPPGSRCSAPLDTTVLVATPENVAFDFRLAGPFSRCLALLIDLTFITIVMVLLGIALLFLGGFGIGLMLFIGFALWWGYGGLMEAYCNGQTLGKKVLGIKVVCDTGLAINAGQAILRNVLRSADLFPPFYPGVVAMLFGSRFQRLGDVAAGTMVVLDGQRTSPRPPWVKSIDGNILEQIPPRYRPDSTVLEALASYVGRRAELSPARRRELAQILAQHFIRVWSLPAKANPDHVLCAIYEHSTTNAENWELRREKVVPIVSARPLEPADVFELPDSLKEAKS